MIIRRIYFFFLTFRVSVIFFHDSRAKTLKLRNVKKMYKTKILVSERTCDEKTGVWRKLMSGEGRKVGTRRENEMMQTYWK